MLNHCRASTPHRRHSTAFHFLSRFFASFAGLLSVLFCAVLLTGCGKKENATNSSSSSASASTKSGTPQIWRVGNGAEPQDLDPQTVTGVPEHKLMMALFEGLVAEDPKDLHPIPGLADRWEISDDGLVYTFHLRPGVKWSDGVPITAQEAVESYQRMLSPALASEYSYLLWFAVGAEEYTKGKLTDFSKTGFKALDASTLQITLKSPTPYLLKIIASHYAWTLVPTHVVKKFGKLDQKRTAWTRTGNHVGSGPFMLKDWVPQQKITVVRNPHYWDAATVKLDAIEFYPTEDIATEERMFRTGQLDMTNELPASKIDTYRKERPEALRIDPWLGVYFYRCNVTRPPLTDKRVRRALALAIDRESLVKAVARGDQLPAYGISYPGTAGYFPRAKLTGGLAEAKRLLAEAGYPDGKGCPPIELLYNTSENHRAIAEAIQQMWRKNLGVEVTLRNEEWKVYLTTQHETHDFTLQRAGWIADYVDPHVFLEIWTTGNGNNDTLWSNPEYDRLFQQALAAKNDTDRYEIYQKMDAILVDEVPVIPIYFYTRVHALSPRVKGYYPTLLDNHPYKYIYLEN
jgi:oligopeptide transport system substrate-binding protein